MNFDPALPSMLGPYTLRLWLAEGGMGMVYLAQRTFPDEGTKWAAVKVLRPEIANDDSVVRMFADEARIASRILHPNVARTFEFGTDGPVHFLGMEYLHGEALNTIVRKAMAIGRLSPLFAARVVADAARGLHAAHTLVLPDGRPAEVVHRDVSPQNIFVLYDGVTKLVDFGVARSIDRLSESTATDVLKGKIGYMAPEQLRREKIDHRVDVFALGIVLWEITLARRLFQAENEAATIFMIASNQVKRPREIYRDYPEGLEKIVMRALAPSRDDRYATAAAMADDLEAFIAEAGEPFARDEVSAAMHDLFEQAILTKDQLLLMPAVTDAPKATGARGSIRPATPVVSPPDGGAPAGDLATAPTSPGFVAPQTGPAMQAMVAPPPASRTGLYVGATVAVVAFAAAFALLAKSRPPATQPPAPPEVVPNAQPPITPPAQSARPGEPSGPRSVRLEISTEPADADLFVDGAPVTNPYDVDLPATGAVHEIEARADGYRTYLLEVAVQFPQRIHIPLRAGDGVDDHRTTRRGTSAATSATH